MRTAVMAILVAFCLVFAGCAGSRAQRESTIAPESTEETPTPPHPDDDFIFETVRSDTMVGVRVFQGNRDNIIVEYAYVLPEHRGTNPVVYMFVFRTTREERTVYALLGFTENDGGDDLLGYLLGVLLVDGPEDTTPEVFSCVGTENLGLCLDMLGNAILLRQEFDLDRRLREVIRETQ